MKPPVFEYERPPKCALRSRLCRSTAAKRSCLPAAIALFRSSICAPSQPGRLIDIGRLTELQYIIEDYGQLRIGALTTHNTIFRSAAVASGCPIMIEAYQHVANHSIRNRGTLGGNLCHNDPAFELPLVIVLLGGSMLARSARSQRTIAADRFFKAPFATDLGARRDAGRDPRSSAAGRPRLCVHGDQPAFRRSRADRRRLSSDHALRQLPRRAHRLSQRCPQRVPHCGRRGRARRQAGFGRRGRGRGRGGRQEHAAAPPICTPTKRIGAMSPPP